MRILVCSKRDLTSLIVLNDLLARLDAIPGCRLGLLLAERTRKIEITSPELNLVKLFERDLPFGFVFPLLERAQAQEGAELAPLGSLIRRYRMEAAVAHSMRDEATLDFIRRFRPDLILSVRFSFIFGRQLVSLPTHGVLNVHPGALPRYGGLYPHVHSVLGGEDQLGCTVHWIVDEGIDTGPVVAQGAVSIDAGRSAFAHNLDSHLLGNRLLVDVVRAVHRGEAPRGVAQDLSRRGYYTYPTQSELDRFRHLGFSLFSGDEYLGWLRRFGTLDLAVPQLSGLLEAAPYGMSVGAVSA